MVADGGTIRAVTVLDLPDGPAIVTSYAGTGSTFTLLACQVE
jgi:hypothetical protein